MDIQEFEKQSLFDYSARHTQDKLPPAKNLLILKYITITTEMSWKMEIGVVRPKDASF
jgi:hypothetical protein